MFKRLSKVSEQLVNEFDKTEKKSDDKKITVNPVVAEVATWYEKLRTAMDYREEEVILRASIERILKRRLLLGGNGQTVAEPLVRELVWARYFPESSVPEKIVDDVSECIDLYLELQEKVITQHKVASGKLSEWIYQLMSSQIEDILSPSKNKELLSNLIYHLYKNKVSISDDDEETKDVQVFIAVRRSFAKEDLALLRYDLFKQFFGNLEKTNLDKVADNFSKAVEKIDFHLKYPLRSRIYNYLKRQTPPFLILEDILKKNRGKNEDLLQDTDKFSAAVSTTCNVRYQQIFNKIRTAIIRSVVFILVTKAILALVIEGAYENITYGSVQWSSIAFNTIIPPIIMVVVGLFIKTPGRDNTQKIIDRLSQVLYEDEPKLGNTLSLQKKPRKKDPILEFIFALLWLVAFFLTFGGIIYVLNWLNLNLVTQGIFLFFLAIVSFLSYRISQTAHIYAMSEEKQNLASVFFDFLFMPFLQVGRSLTIGVSKVNIFIFFFDFFIETPFKGIFSFFEQWFLYLRSEREKLD